MAEDSPYADEMRRCNDDTTPIDVHGKAGDIVFWCVSTRRVTPKVFYTCDTQSSLYTSKAEWRE
jgi:hypothetical protein